jgi:mRNA-degrading endonuclease RelE of RelBE toxin-antitoxin system
MYKMNTDWLLTMKPSFNTQWLKLPSKESHQVHEKITLLTQDPTPDAKVKKQLKYMNKNLYRIRSGDYRIFYTFERPYISLLTLRLRSDDTYEDDLDVEFLGGFDPPFDGTTKTVLPDWEQPLTSYTTEKRLLPEHITEKLLNDLFIPPIYHNMLLPIQTEDELLNMSDIPNDLLLQLLESLFPRKLDQILQQDDYIVSHVDDLLRIKKGEYLNFLLRLAPEQEQAASWAKNASGPTQVTGRPGTGKSTVALYRVKSVLEKLRREQVSFPHILFTTYTKALVESSRQLLQQLLGEDIKYIKIETADSIVYSILK